MTNSREAGVRNALASTKFNTRECARWTRTMFGVAALGDFDGDKAADAEDMWKAAKIKHPGDRNPPDGVPVYWGGGSEDNGHAAVTVPRPAGAREAHVRSLDRPKTGDVSTVPLSEIEKVWGMEYLGWSEDLYGNDIPSEEAERLDKQIAKWSEKRATLKTRLARARARRKEIKKS